VAPDPRPVKLEPRLVQRIWGGRRLEAWGKALPGQATVGESWEVYDDASGSARCAGPAPAGAGLGELASAWGKGLYGEGRGPVQGRFPLLVKLIDARDDLSVQVHPDDALARELHGADACGKSEMWVVLEAPAGARVLNGFRPGTTPERLRQALADGTVAGLLNTVAVRPGDVIDVPAGKPHAIGAGCMVAEVQQNSDLTYRLWDYGRLENGKPRALHLEQAGRALRFDGVGCGDGRVQAMKQRQAWGASEALVRNAYFSVERWTLAPAGPGVHLQAGRLRVLVPLQGSLRVEWGAGGAALALARGETALIPAAAAVRIDAGGEGARVLCVELV